MIKQFPIFLLAAVAILLLLGSYSASAAIPCPSGAICDDFESQTSSSPSGQWTVLSPDCSGTGTIEIDSTFAYSGNKSLKVNGGGGFCNHVFAQLAGVDTMPGDDLYVRFWIYHDTPLPGGHTAFLTMQDENDGGKDLRMGGQNSVLQWNREADDATIPVQSPAGTSLVPALPVNQWNCLEIYVDQANGELQVWLDEVELEGMKRDNTPTADIDSQWASGWIPDISNLRLGWEDYGGGPDTLWFDDVIVDTTAIGCESEPVTPTATITPGGPTLTPTNTPMPTAIPSVDMHIEAYVSKQIDAQTNGVREMTVNIRAINDSAAPYSNITARIWFDFSELGGTGSIGSNANYTGCQGGGTNGTLTGPIASTVPDVVYFEIDYASVPGSNYCDGQFRVFKSNFQPPFNDDSNDWSLIGMSEGNYETTERVTLYMDGALVYGNEPDGLAPAITETPTIQPTDTATPTPTATPDDLPLTVGLRQQQSAPAPYLLIALFAVCLVGGVVVAQRR